MKLKHLSLALAATASMILPMATADAHGIWFAQRAKQLAIIYGIGADDLDMVKRMPKLERVDAYDADYNPIHAEARVAGAIVLIDCDAQPTLVSAVLQNGIWSRIGDAEFEAKTLEEMPDATISERTIKYAVTIQGPLSNPIPLLPTQKLQIIPQGPIPEKLGQPLTYKVYFDGKPLAGARMINDMVNDPDAAEKLTAADGTITMPVRNQGLNVIRAVFNGPTDDPKKYYHIEATATLSFTLPHVPE